MHLNIEKRRYSAFMKHLAFDLGAESGKLTIGVDAWSVDFALLDRNGHLIGIPNTYIGRHSSFRIQVVESLISPTMSLFSFSNRFLSK